MQAWVQIPCTYVKTGYGDIQVQLALACSAGLFIYFTAKHCRHGYLLIYGPFSKAPTLAGGNCLAERFLKPTLKGWLELTDGKWLSPLPSEWDQWAIQASEVVVESGNAQSASEATRFPGLPLLDLAAVPYPPTSVGASLILRHPNIQDSSQHGLSYTFFFFIPLFKSTRFRSVYGFVHFLCVPFIHNLAGLSSVQAGLHLFHPLVFPEQVLALAPSGAHRLLQRGGANMSTWCHSSGWVCLTVIFPVWLFQLA